MSINTSGLHLSLEQPADERTTILKYSEKTPAFPMITLANSEYCILFDIEVNVNLKSIAE